MSHLLKTCKIPCSIGTLNSKNKQAFMLAIRFYFSFFFVLFPFFFTHSLFSPYTILAVFKHLAEHRWSERETRGGKLLPLSYRGIISSPWRRRLLKWKFTMENPCCQMCQECLHACMRRMLSSSSLTCMKARSWSLISSNSRYVNFKTLLSSHSFACF